MGLAISRALGERAAFERYLVVCCLSHEVDEEGSLVDLDGKLIDLDCPLLPLSFSGETAQFLAMRVSTELTQGAERLREVRISIIRKIFTQLRTCVASLRAPRDEGHPGCGAMVLGYIIRRLGDEELKVVMQGDGSEQWQGEYRRSARHLTMKLVEMRIYCLDAQHKGCNPIPGFVREVEGLVNSEIGGFMW
jgi:hypothetical protein